MDKKTGGPAFPAAEAGRSHFGDSGAYMGMTLRDYFAAKAMPTIYAEALREGAAIGFGMDWIDCVARDAYAMADAMLKAKLA